jgi:hypothetical protein
MVRKTRKQRKMKKIGGSIEPQTIKPQTIEPPSTLDNVKKVFDIGLQIGDNVAALGLEKLEDVTENVSESLGIDPNKSVTQEVSRIGDKVEEIQNALDTPEGKKALQNASNLLSDISEDVIAPAVEKGMSQILDHSEPIITKGQNALLNIVSASPIGPVLDLSMLASNSLGVVENTVSMVNDVTGTAKETVEQIKDKEDDIKGVWSNIMNVIQQGTSNINSGVSNGLNNIQNRVNNYGREIVKNNNPVSQINNNPVSQINNIHKEGVKIGGRIHKSQMAFLKPTVNKTRILKRYKSKSKRKTKKLK